MYISNSSYLPQAKPASELSLRLSSCEEGSLQANSQFKVSLYSTVFPSSSVILFC